MSAKKLFIYCNLALIIAAVISGLSFVAQKTGMEYVGPFTFNTLRCCIGGICLLPLIFLQEKLNKQNGKKTSKYSNKTLTKGGFLTGLALFAAFSINQYCMIYAQAGKAGFITSLYIIFVPLIAVFLKQKLLPNVKISILLALFGLYLLCAKGGTVFEIWDVFLFISAFFFALHIITTSHYSKKTSTIKLAAVQFFTAGLLSLPLMFIFENPSLASIIAGYKPILFIGIVVTAVAYTLQIFGYKAANPVLGALILSSEAIFAVLGGIFILGETLNLHEIAGCIIMTSAIILSQIPIKNKKVSKLALESL